MCLWYECCAGAWRHGNTCTVLKCLQQTWFRHTELLIFLEKSILFCRGTVIGGWVQQKALVTSERECLLFSAVQKHVLAFIINAFGPYYYFYAQYHRIIMFIISLFLYYIFFSSSYPQSFWKFWIHLFIFAPVITPGPCLILELFWNNVFFC